MRHCCRRPSGIGQDKPIYEILHEYIRELKFAATLVATEAGTRTILDAERP